MSDLVGFLGARYDEFEAAAKAAGGGSWVAEGRGYGAYAVADEDGDPVVYDEGRPTELQAVHIALNDPKTVLADIAAKRKILDLWESPAEVEKLPEGVHDGRDPDERERDVTVAETIDRVVRLLAARFASHADFNPAWVTE